VVDIEHRALRALKQHGFSVANGGIDQQRRVAHHGADAFGEALIFLPGAVEIEFLVDTQRLGDGDFFFHQRGELSAETVTVEQVGDANSAARDLVLVARTDTTRGGSDGYAPGPPFRHLFHHAVSRQHYVRAITDRQRARNLDSRGLQRVDLGQQCGWIDHQAVADHSALARTQDAARNQFQDELFISDKNRVAGIVPALIAHHQIESFGEEIDHLPLSFVAPLSAKDNYIPHFGQTDLLYRSQTSPFALSLVSCKMSLEGGLDSHAR